MARLYSGNWEVSLNAPVRHYEQFLEHPEQWLRNTDNSQTELALQAGWAVMRTPIAIPGRPVEEKLY